MIHPLFKINCHSAVDAARLPIKLKLLTGIYILRADPGFQVRGAHLKTSREHHDFTHKNHIFSNFRGGGYPPPPGSAPDTTEQTDQNVQKRDRSKMFIKCQRRRKHRTLYSKL